jgi:polysaccharide export outer membrane protein
MRSKYWLWLALVSGVLVAPLGAQRSNYVVGPEDVLGISVFEQTALSGKFTVEADGTFTFPFIGRIKVGGLMLREVEEELKRRLSDGFLRNPQVSVAVEQYRSQRVFVMGEVHTPGTYPITGDMTLIEVLARAGYTTTNANGEVVILRSNGSSTGTPILPGQGDEAAEVLKIDLRELASGALSTNVALRDGDTVFVPTSEVVYVFGHVRNPGGYPMKKGTTVLQALSLAGGVTDRGSTARIKVVRSIDGKRKEVGVKLTDLVQPFDTIIVPERFL